MHMNRFAGAGVLALSGFSLFGCANQVGQAEATGTSAFELRVERYRYEKEQLLATIEMRPEGDHVLEGSDNARLAALMAIPNAGILVDPVEENLSWIYTTEAERAALMADAHARVPLKVVDELPPGVLRDHAGSLKTFDSSYGCLVPGTTLFQNDNYGGASFFFSGAIRNLADFSFDNETSSVFTVSGDVILYENPVWSGHSIVLVPNLEIRLSTCPVSQPYGLTPSLSGRTMSTSFWFWTTSWERQASSTSYEPWQYP
jgi:hypothetical protein